MKAKRNLILSLLTLLLLLCCSVALVACNNNSYTVAFKVDDRNFDVVLADEGNSVSLPSPPEKDGYTFDGWYADESCTQKYTDSASISQDTDLYAKFTPNVYTITYDADGGTNPNTTTSFTVEDKVVLADAQKPGYLFKGWKNGDEYMTAIPKGTAENISLTAVFQKEGYSIFYENVDGAYHSNQKAYAVDDETFEIDPANKEGYNFDGWYLTEDFSGDEVTEIAKGTTGNITLYAKFDLMEYTITYENTKGAENRNENYFTTYSIENPVYSFFDLEKQGYVFEGWFHGTTPITRLMGDEWLGDVTLTAKWTPVTYSISYKNDKGQANGNKTSFTVDSGILEFADLPDTLDYEFKGWSFMNGNVPTTSLDASILSDDIILTAMWKQKAEYKGLDYYVSPDKSSIVIMGVTDTSITEIVIPDTTVMVLNGAFKDCSSVTSITIPFFGFKRGATENTTIHHLFGDTVPATLKEVTVKNTNVPDEAFKDCTSIKTVNLVGNIGTIGKSAFENCSGIFYVNFNGVTLTSIGEKAFSYCGNLLTLRLPEGLTEIGKMAFYKCGTLYSVTMPTSITDMSQIGFYAFWYCESLYEIYNLANLELTIGEYSDTDLGYCAKDVYTSADAVSRFSTDAKGNIFYNDATDGLTLIRYISTDTTYAIPEDVTTIQKAAFKDRNDMVEITLPSGLKKIGDEAFMNATGFDSLRITQEGLVVGASAFNGCSTITSLEILADGVNLGESCFSNCSNLVSINIDADNLKFSGAFRSLTLPQTLRIKTSGSYFSLTFSGCSGIKEFILDGDNNTIYYAFQRASVETVTINGNNVNIEQMAFQDCTSLKTFTVNGGNCHFGAAIFRDCTKLETITVTGGITSEIGGSAFSGCSSLKEFNYFGSLQSIGQIAFRNCTSLKKVEFGASLTSVGREAFKGCT
ncbi:MAG: leucine-rich repeat protein, partial [Christensenellaceae bacterium]